METYEGNREKQAGQRGERGSQERSQITHQRRQKGFESQDPNLQTSEDFAGTKLSILWLKVVGITQWKSGSQGEGKI